ncbi:MAG: hypothetical protein R3242_05015 [Akkermansiaceae bacterium]|nr:hypothetical protein [Akkermansiaceae bacterium]
MNDATNPEMSLREPVPPPVEKEKSKRGCVVKVLIGLVAAVLLLLATGYYVLFHTAIPARMLAGVINQNPRIQIEGIEGSLKSGFSVATMRFEDAMGNVNELDDVRLRYRTEGDLMVITEVHVGRGLFYVDRSGDEPAETTEEPYPESGGGDPMEVLIESISINDITLVDVGTGEAFKMEGFHVDRLRIGKEFSMGTASLRSSGLDLTITPQDGAEVSDRFDVDFLAKPAFHENVIAAIDLKGTVEIIGEDQHRMDLSGFDGKFSIEGDSDVIAVSLRDFDSRDYFKSGLPFEDVDLEIQMTGSEGTLKGSFQLGESRFAIAQAIQDEGGLDRNPVIATSEQGDTRYQLVISQSHMEKGDFSSIQLRSQPAMAHRDAVAMMLTGSAYGELTEQERAEVDEVGAMLQPPESE